MKLQDMSALILEDSPNMAAMLRGFLSRMGIGSIRIAETVEAAKSALAQRYDEKKTYDLIFSDHHLPDGTGLEFLKWVKAQDSYKNIIFISCTSDASREVVLPHITHGAAAFLVKPVTLGQLTEKLNFALSRKSA